MHHQSEFVFAKVDIWAAGVTLIQCADLIEPYAGQNPFRYSQFDRSLMLI